MRLFAEMQLTSCATSYGTAQAGRLQYEISRNDGFHDLWSPNGSNLGSEDDTTDWVRRRLIERLGRDRVILTREPQVERLADRGSGTRIDLTADAPIQHNTGRSTSQ
jgi:hypothetical protein